MKTADEFRADLLKTIPDDPELVEATTLRYFRGLRKRTRPIRKRSRKLVGETTHQFNMREGSENLLSAINAARRGHKPIANSTLIWNSERTGGNSVHSETQRKSVAEIDQRRKRVEALKVDAGSPCWHCGAARSCECSQ